jgi:hypothetical protein
VILRVERERDGELALVVETGRLPGLLAGFAENRKENRRQHGDYRNDYQ